MRVTAAFVIVFLVCCVSGDALQRKKSHHGLQNVMKSHTEKVHKAKTAATSQVAMFTSKYDQLQTTLNDYFESTDTPTTADIQAILDAETHFLGSEGVANSMREMNSQLIQRIRTSIISLEAGLDYVLRNYAPGTDAQIDTAITNLKAQLASLRLRAFDWCAPNPCLNNGQCTSDPSTNTDSHVCDCSNTGGHTGTNCEADACAKLPCMNGGTCSPSESAPSYTCDCTFTGFEGTNCDAPLDPCSHQPCLNGAVCAGSSDGKFTCTCAAGFSGPTCAEGQAAGGAASSTGASSKDSLSGLAAALAASGTPSSLSTTGDQMSLPTSSAVASGQDTASATASSSNSTPTASAASTAAAVASSGTADVPSASTGASAVVAAAASSTAVAQASTGAV